MMQPVRLLQMETRWSLGVRIKFFCHKGKNSAKKDLLDVLYNVDLCFFLTPGVAQNPIGIDT